MNKCQVHATQSSTSQSMIIPTELETALADVLGGKTLNIGQQKHAANVNFCG